MKTRQQILSKIERLKNSYYNNELAGTLAIVNIALRKQLQWVLKDNNLNDEAYSIGLSEKIQRIPVIKNHDYTNHIGIMEIKKGIVKKDDCFSIGFVRHKKGIELIEISLVKDKEYQKYLNSVYSVDKSVRQKSKRVV